jgi:cobalamin synthase
MWICSGFVTGMKKAPEGAFCVSFMTQLPVPRRGDVAKRSASELRRGTGS